MKCSNIYCKKMFWRCFVCTSHGNRNILHWPIKTEVLIYLEISPIQIRLETEGNDGLELLLRLSTDARVDLLYILQ